MSSSFLFESGFWGLPYGSLARDPKDVAPLLSDVLARERFTVGKIRVWYSARRFGFLLEDVSETQMETTTETRGPKASVAFDLNNQPTPAAVGFASNCGIPLGELAIVEVDGEKYLFAVKKEKGKKLLDLYPGLALKLLKTVPWKKHEWVKDAILPHPPCYICSMLDGQTSDLTIDGEKATSETGILEQAVWRRIAIPHAMEFSQILSDAGIQALPGDRQKYIESQLQSIGGGGATVRKEKSLLERASFELENPKTMTFEVGADGFSLPTGLMLKLLSEPPVCLPFESTKGGLFPKLTGFVAGRSVAADEAQFRTIGIRKKMRMFWEYLEADKKQELAELPHDPNGAVSSRLFAWMKALGGSLCPEISETLLMEMWRYLRSAVSFRLVRKFPEVKFTVLAEIARARNADPLVVGTLEDCQFLAGDRETLPATVPGTVLVLASLIHESEVAKKSSPTGSQAPQLIEKALNLLLSKGLHVDVARMSRSILGSGGLDRPIWLELFWHRTVKEEADRKKHEWLLAGDAFDPTAVCRALRAWPEGMPPERDILVALYHRIASRVPRGMKIGEPRVPPSSQVEQALDVRLTDLEKLSSPELKEIFDVLLSARIEIEACLMDLPAVLDETDPAQASRISILGRSLAQISRFPLPVGAAVAPIHPLKEANTYVAVKQSE